MCVCSVTNSLHSSHIISTGQFSQEEDRRLVSTLLDEQLSAEDEIQVIEHKNRPFELDRELLNKSFNKIARENDLSSNVVSNIIQQHLRGSTQAFISRYEQHFNFGINPNLVTKIIKDFQYLLNVIKLKNLKRLVLLKKNRFDSFGSMLLDQCASYENVAMVFFLYFENTKPDVYLNDELALKILNNKQQFDSSLFNKIPNHQNSSNLLYELMVKMIGHYLSRNEKLIEFLNKLEERPTFTVKLNKNQPSNVAEKYKKWLYQDAIKIEEQSPVDALTLIYAEELNQLKLEFDCTRIERNAYQLLVDDYLAAEESLLKDCFDYTWSFYFKNQLECYFRYEIKIRSKKLLRDDFQLILKSVLLKEPVINRTILCLEPQGKVILSFYCFLFFFY